MRDARRRLSLLSKTMPAKRLLTSPTHSHAADLPGPVDLSSDLADALAPIHAAAVDSTSLIASRHPITLSGRDYELSKFLLLGQRGGGAPIRLGLFAGFEAGNLESIRATADLLLQLKASPALTRDYALLAYPVVNIRGFTEEATALSDFERRFARDSADQDVQFFQGELRRWAFNGILSIRADLNAHGFHATVRSELLANEVVIPALAVAAGALPLAAQAVKVRPDDRYARAADHAHGRLIPPADVRPYPFEVELFAPRSRSSDDLADGIFLAVTEILRHYRALVAHAPDL